MARPDRTEMISFFESIHASFPDLSMDLVLEHPHVDLFMEIPMQAGLAFGVSINLQLDELHLNAGPFWVEWFPCTKPEVLEQFEDAVSGLLSGRYRILVSEIGSRAVKAQLQRPDADRWKTIATWSNLGVLSWRPRTERIMQNKSADHATSD